MTSHGSRSATAIKVLVNAGYTKVHDLGSIINWKWTWSSSLRVVRSESRWSSTAS